MYNRRDQVQAHTFLKNRLVAALLRTDPDGVDIPLRRTPMGVVSGSIVGLLVVAGVLVVAILSPNGGSQNWRKPGSLVVDKDTGASYVLASGTLRPVLNLASARLLLGPKMTVTMVPGKALAGVPHGNPVGIVGAPDTLPAPGPNPIRTWSVCAITVSADGANRPGVAVSVDAGAQAPAPDDRVLLARAADHSLHLIWHDHRHAVPNEWALRAIGVDPAVAIEVRDSWLDALPAGPDLAAPVPSRGAPGPVLDGHPTTTGQLLVVPAAMPQRQLYLVVPGGLMPVTEELAAMLVLGDPATARAYGSDRVAPVEVSPAEIAAATVVPAPVWQAQLPPTQPAVLHGQPEADGGVPCLRTITGPTPAGPELVVAAAPAGVSPDGPGVKRDALVADRVLVGPGAGLLARSAPAPGVTGAGLHLITEDGVRFPVATADAAAALGIPADQASAIPTRLTDLLPTGPLLSMAPGSTP